jgi:ParB/RepB/Spo0J family partition protein
MTEKFKGVAFGGVHFGEETEDVALSNHDISSNEEIVDRVVRMIDINLVFPNPVQFRKIFDGIDELATNIKEKGMFQPIIVKRSGDKFMIVAGERRWRAANLISLKKIPALILKDNASISADDLNFIENMQRKSLKKIEEYSAIRELKRRGKSADEILRMSGRKGDSYISKCIRVSNFIDTACSGGFTDYNSIAKVIEGRTLDQLYEVALLSDDNMQLAVDAIKEIADKDMSSRTGREYIDAVRGKATFHVDSTINEPQQQKVAVIVTTKKDKDALLTDVINLKVDTLSDNELTKNSEQQDINTDKEEQHLPSDLLSTVSADGEKFTAKETVEMSPKTEEKKISAEHNELEWSVRFVKWALNDLTVLINKLDGVHDAILVIPDNKHREKIINTIDQIAPRLHSISANLNILKKKIAISYGGDIQTADTVE